MNYIHLLDVAVAVAVAPAVAPAVAVDVDELEAPAVDAAPAVEVLLAPDAAPLVAPAPVVCAACLLTFTSCWMLIFAPTLLIVLSANCGLI